MKTQLIKSERKLIIFGDVVIICVNFFPSFSFLLMIHLRISIFIMLLNTQIVKYSFLFNDLKLDEPFDDVL